MPGRGWFLSWVVVLLVAGGCAYRAHKRAAGWLVVETQHVQLRTNVSRDRAAEIALEMQRIRDVLVRHAFPCAFQGSASRLPVTVLPASEYRDFAPAHAGGFYRSSMVGWLPDYEGQIILPDDLDLEVQRTLQHEIVHHLVASCLPAAPRWLHEGLACFLETALVDSEKVRFGEPPYLIMDDVRRRPQLVRHEGRTITLMPLHLLPSIQRIIATRSDSWRRHDAIELTASYATAWALVHFLELGARDLTPRFRNYLEALRNFGGDPEAVFTRTFDGVPLQERLEAYLKRGAFPLMASRSSVGAARKADARVREMRDGEAHLHLAWLWSGVLDRGGRGPFLAHLAAAKRHERTRVDTTLLGALVLLERKDPVGAERQVVAALRDAPGDASVLQAHLHLLLERRAPAAAVLAVAERLRPLARTADQLCTLARVELGKQDAAAARELVVRGLTLRPSSWLCRRVEEQAWGYRSSSSGLRMHRLVGMPAYGP
jgi:hypothetical protein